MVDWRWEVGFGIERCGEQVRRVRVIVIARPDARHVALQDARISGAEFYILF